MKIYLASPLSEAFRADLYDVANVLRNLGMYVYVPCEHKIDNAWDYLNNEWGAMVFCQDIQAIKDCDFLVLLSYGRKSTAGANWEAGYAFGIGKKVIVVEMTDNIMSLMVANGRYATVKGLAGIKEYNWNTLPKTRTNTEQK
jgi:nucleoside 2-deoxyribosyltransferase